MFSSNGKSTRHVVLVSHGFQKPIHTLKLVLTALESSVHILFRMSKNQEELFWAAWGHVKEDFKNDHTHADV